jgi:hypothetical protein
MEVRQHPAPGHHRVRLSDPAGVAPDTDGEQITRCRTIGRRVAERVELMLAAGGVE